MLLSCSCVLALLAAAPSLPGDLVLSRSIETTTERATDVIDRAWRDLQARGVALRPPTETRARLLAAGLGAPEACAAKRACLVKLLQKLGSPLLVAVDVGHVGDEMAIGFEALSPEGTSLAQHRFMLKTAGYPAGFDGHAETFARALRPAAADAPTTDLQRPALVPTPAVLPTTAPTAVAARPWPPLTLGAGGAAVATGVAGVVFTALGLQAMGTLDAARYTSGSSAASHLTAPDAQRLANTANTELTVALVCALGTAALASVATWAALTPAEAPR